MAGKADSPPSYYDDAEERYPLLREIGGIVLGLVALLMLLALVSHQQDAKWIGQRGRDAAAALVLVFGQVVAYALPVMIGISAFHLLRRPQPDAAPSRTWLRGLGGLMILIATCALLTLPAAFAAEGYDKARALAMGGIVGNFLMYAGAHGQGLGLARQLGPVGSALIFGGLSLIGLVLLTERFVRDFVGLVWAGSRGVGGVVRRPRLAGRLTSFAPLRPLARLGGAAGAVRDWHPLAALVAWFRGVRFTRERHKGAVFTQHGPILGLSPAGRGVRAAEEAGPADPQPAPAAGRASRSSSLLPRLNAHPHQESPAPEPAPPAVPPAAPAEDHTGIALERPIPTPEMPRPRTRVEPVQSEMDLFPSEFVLPSLDLLVDPPATRYVMSEAEKDAVARKIEETLATFKIEVSVVEVIQGPVITRFALKVAPGVRVNRILALESELAMAMKAHHVRILAPIPGQSAVGIEVPNKRSNTVMLKELLDCEEFQNHKSTLAFALGKNIAGEPAVCDLAQMPHLLIAGATGSGKSVCLNTIIASFLYRNKPDRVKFVMIDPKRVELSIYQAIPHLYAPVVTEPKKAAAALAWCVEQMEDRYKKLAELGVRNIDGYNSLATSREPHKKLMGRELKFMPHIVIIIDELADLMMVAKNEVEEYIIRLAQMARAVGMHLILATQRPSVNVITGIIKANFPSRIAFQVSSKVDSRTILDLNGAEALMGRGDMLYSPGGVKPFRLQGAYVSDAEVERLADYIREQEKARYEKEDFEIKPTPAERAKAHRGLGDDDGDDDLPWDESEGSTLGGPAGGMAARGRASEAPLKPCDIDAMSDEEMYEMALQLVLESRKASVSYIQRRMKIGYARAGRLMDMMEEQGIVGPYQGSKPRDLLVDPKDYLGGGEAD